MTVGELAKIASSVEIRTEMLYRDMAVQFGQDPKMTRLLLELADQEAEHAALISRAMEHATDPERDMAWLDGSEFGIFFDTLDDVEDELRTDGLSTRAALEIIVHLEKSVAEEFYGAVPRAVEGLPGDFVRVMIESCRVHRAKIEEFRRHCLAEM